ncbi:hypothetical protein AMECASPLE_023451 [Ameca splendens]|uniref:Uncharacterized protein n=1 Tax=Ameca splendens TaxID=208324 RepID=A0ABV0Y406_9TELE
MEKMVTLEKVQRRKVQEKKNTGSTSALGIEGKGLEPAKHDENSVILRELRGLREERAVVVGENKRFSKLETSIKELMERTTSLEQKVGHMEERVGNTEDNTMRMERAVAVLLRETTKLSKKCDDLEARMRHNNIRIHGIPEGAAKDNTISFIT